MCWEKGKPLTLQSLQLVHPYHPCYTVCPGSWHSELSTDFSWKGFPSNTFLSRLINSTCWPCRNAVQVIALGKPDMQRKGNVFILKFNPSWWLQYPFPLRINLVAVAPVVPAVQKYLSYGFPSCKLASIAFPHPFTLISEIQGNTRSPHESAWKSSS